MVRVTVICPSARSSSVGLQWSVVASTLSGRPSPQLVFGPVQTGPFFYAADSQKLAGESAAAAARGVVARVCRIHRRGVFLVAYRSSCALGHKRLVDSIPWPCIYVPNSGIASNRLTAENARGSQPCSSEE